MGRLPGINHLKAVRAFERAGFTIKRQSGHIIMTDGQQILVIPRNNPIDPKTMFGIVRDSGLTLEQFRELL